MGYEIYNQARDSTLAQGRAQMQQIEEMNAKRTRRQAGNALAGGDYGGAANALLQGGDLEAGMAVQGAQRGIQTADREQTKAAVLSVVTGLRQLPAEARAAQLQAIGPRLAAFGVTPEQLATITPDDLSDQGLDSLISMMGGEVQRPTAYNMRHGIVERDPYGGGYKLAYEAPEQDPNAPAGYRWTEDGALEAIPGGPADPRVAGGLAASRRAAPRPRSSGGGGGGSRPSGGSAPAAPARKPWERF